MSTTRDLGARVACLTHLDTTRARRSTLEQELGGSGATHSPALVAYCATGFYPIQRCCVEGSDIGQCRRRFLEQIPDRCSILEALLFIDLVS